MGGSVLEDKYNNLPGFDSSLNGSTSTSGLFFDSTRSDEFWDETGTVMTGVSVITKEDAATGSDKEQRQMAKRTPSSSSTTKLKRRTSRRNSMDRKARAQSVIQKVEEILAERQDASTQQQSQQGEGKQELRKKGRSQSASSLADLINPKAPRHKRRTSARNMLNDDSKTNNNRREHRRASRRHSNQSRAEARMKAAEELAESVSNARQRTDSSATNNHSMISNNALASLAQSAIPDQTAITALSVAEAGPNKLTLTVNFSSAQNLMALVEEATNVNTTKEKQPPKLRRRKTSEGQIRKRSTKRTTSDHNLLAGLVSDESQSSTSKTKRKSSSTKTNYNGSNMCVSEGGVIRARLDREDEAATSTTTRVIRKGRVSKSSSTSKLMQPVTSLRSNSLPEESVPPLHSIKESNSSTQLKGLEDESATAVKPSRTRSTKKKRSSSVTRIDLTSAPESQSEAEEEKKTPERRRSNRKKRSSSAQGLRSNHDSAPALGLGTIKEASMSARKGRDLTIQAKSLRSLSYNSDQGMSKSDRSAGSRKSTASKRSTSKKAKVLRSLSYDSDDRGMNKSDRSACSRKSTTSKRSTSTRDSKKGRAYESDTGLMNNQSERSLSRRRHAREFSARMIQKSMSLRGLSCESDDTGMDSQSERSVSSRRKRKNQTLRKSLSFQDLKSAADSFGLKKAARRMSESGSKAKGSMNARASAKRAVSMKSLSLDDAFASCRVTAPKLTSAKSVSEGMLKPKRSEKTNRSTRSNPERKVKRRNSYGTRLNAESLAEARLTQRDEAQPKSQTKLEAKAAQAPSRSRRKRRVSAASMALPSLQSFLGEEAKAKPNSNLRSRLRELNHASSADLSLDDTIANSTGVSLASTITNSCGVSLASTIANSTGVSLASTIANSTGSGLDDDEFSTAGFSLSSEVSRITHNRRRRHSAGHGPSQAQAALVQTFQQIDKGAPIASSVFRPPPTNIYAEEHKNAVWVHRRIRALGSEESDGTQSTFNSGFSLGP